jgi:hypothetical protein
MLTQSSAERALERLVEAVRSADARVATSWLEPDGRYQTCGMTLDALTDQAAERLRQGISHLEPEQLPVVYCGWGKARVGSTALVNLFGVAGLPAYYQPVKAVLRHVLTGGRAKPWSPASRDVHPRVFIKDVAGPYLLAECLFIPLQALVEAGYPPAKLHLVILDRHPESSLASWLTKWSDRVSEDRLVRHYVLAALNARRVESYARCHGVAVTHYVYEASRDPVAAIRALFTRLGIADRFNEAIVTEWNEMGALDSDKSRIIYPDEPPVFHVAGLHATDTGYRYRHRSTARVTDAYRALLAHTGVRDVYRAAVKACAQDLGFDRALSRRLFGEDFAGGRRGVVSAA